MPLITCPDCSSQVSDAAPSCPKCGRPIALQQVQVTGSADQQPIAVYVRQTKQGMSARAMGCLIFIGFSFLTVVSVIYAKPDRVTPPPAPEVIGGTAPKPTKAKTKEELEACRLLIKTSKMTWLKEIEWKAPKPPHVVITDFFFTGSREFQQMWADAIECSLVNGEARNVDFDLIQGSTGKVAAIYSGGNLSRP